MSADDATNFEAALGRIVRGFEVLDKRQDIVDQLDHSVRALGMHVERLCTIIEKHPKGTMLERMALAEERIEDMDSTINAQEKWIKTLVGGLVTLLLSFVGEIIFFAVQK